MLAAARAAGVRRFIAQSFAGWTYARAGGPVKTEEDPLDPEPPAAFRRTLEAIRYLESAVTGETGLEGLVLRYGAFYGPGTAISEQGWMVSDIRKRRIPVIGGGGGVWSFTHVDDAARFTRAAAEVSVIYRKRSRADARRSAVKSASSPNEFRLGRRHFADHNGPAIKRGAFHLQANRAAGSRRPDPQ